MSKMEGIENIALLALAYTVNFNELCELGLGLFSIVMSEDNFGDIYSGLFQRFYVRRDGRDEYNVLIRKPRLFWTVTGLTPEESKSIFFAIRFRELIVPRRRREALTPVNKLLLFLIWMRQYPSYGLLSVIF